MRNLNIKHRLMVELGSNNKNFTLLENKGDTKPFIPGPRLIQGAHNIWRSASGHTLDRKWVALFSLNRWVSCQHQRHHHPCLCGLLRPSISCWRSEQRAEFSSHRLLTRSHLPQTLTVVNTAVFLKQKGTSLLVFSLFVNFSFSKQVKMVDHLH